MYRSAVEGTGYTLITSLPVSAIGFNDKTAQKGANYYYVTAMDAAVNESIHSTEVVAVVP